jgi:hypothetical protein
VYHSADSHPYGWVGYKKATLSALLAAGSDTAVFDISAARNATVLINDESLNGAWNAKTPAHPITAGMTYAPVTCAIAATNAAGASIWWNRVTIAGAAVTSLSGAAYGSAEASGTLTTPALAYPSLAALITSRFMLNSGHEPVRAPNGSLGVRRLWSADKGAFAVDYQITAAQKATLDAYYAANKDLNVAFTRPDTGAAHTVRFAGPPQYVWTPGGFRARVQLEEV